MKFTVIPTAGKVAILFSTCKLIIKITISLIVIDTVGQSRSSSDGLAYPVG